MRREITKKEALIIHNIITNPEDLSEEIKVEGFRESYESWLRFASYVQKGARSLSGMNNLHGVEIGRSLIERIESELSVSLQSLTGRVFKEGGLMNASNRLNLCLLTNALPDEVVGPYFDHDPREKAKELGVDYEDFLESMSLGYSGTKGVAGKQGFALLIDEDYFKDVDNYVKILSLNNSHSSDSYDQLGSCGRTFEVYSKYALGILAEAINFQGASHYTNNEVQK